jgi:hypothetical protein
MVFLLSFFLVLFTTGKRCVFGYTRMSLPLSERIKQRHPCRILRSYCRAQSALSIHGAARLRPSEDGGRGQGLCWEARVEGSDAGKGMGTGVGRSSWTRIEGSLKGWGPSLRVLSSDLTPSPVFFPAHRRHLFAPFPCISAYGRGWEEFRLGPGGSELATFRPPTPTRRPGLGANWSIP